jgi:CRP-like cAMP-binding protein
LLIYTYYTDIIIKKGVTLVTHQQKSVGELMSMHIKLLKNSALMNDLSYHEICSYLQTGKFKIVSYNKNSFVHFEGEECSKAELVLSGEAGIIQINESGDMFVISEITNDNIIGGNIIFT